MSLPEGASSTALSTTVWVPSDTPAWDFTTDFPAVLAAIEVGEDLGITVWALTARGLHGAIQTRCSESLNFQTISGCIASSTFPLHLSFCGLAHSPSGADWRVLQEPLSSPLPHEGSSSPRSYAHTIRPNAMGGGTVHCLPRHSISAEGRNSAGTIMRLENCATTFSCSHILRQINVTQQCFQLEKKKRPEKPRRHSRSRSRTPPSPPAFRGRNTAMDAQEALARR
ncbi:hypothetical protein AB205_0049200 [Aquarana catesbeiana]|uniref:Uncharacterized protein n=1 Tax=Aquarana catesbeiana TaxID=8400 RepID=A0A2G9SD17_AQUCT|nr:hypothetical protein AB205_0049200 [Aquarana catesbeiana]